MLKQSSLDEAADLYACEHLGESEDVVESSVLEIKQFLRENPNIKARDDQRTILCFLRSCKFNVEQTEKKIKEYSSPFKSNKSIINWGL